jgi:hypothetical protein
VTKNVEETGEALGLLFAETLVQIADGNVPLPLSGVVREKGSDKFSIHAVPDGDLDAALRSCAKPEVQDAAWLFVTDDDEEQSIRLMLCAAPAADPPFSVIAVVRFDDDGDELQVSNPTVMVPQGADDGIPDAFWPAINRGMTRHEGLLRAPVVFGKL